MTALLAVLLLAAASPDAPASAVPGAAPFAGNPRLLASGVPPVPEDLRRRVFQYQNARSAVLADVAEDGSAALVLTRFGNTRQLHVVERPLGMREQITFGEEPVASARFQPGDPRVVWYRQDQGGGEFYQVYRLDRRTGRSELVTDRMTDASVGPSFIVTTQPGRQRAGCAGASRRSAWRRTAARSRWRARPVALRRDRARALPVHRRSDGPDVPLPR
jgi:hypothetical protein